MRAVIWDGPGAMSVIDAPDPHPAPGTVVVEVGVAGVCGSDVTSYLGRMGVSRPGQIRGHEFAGTVVATCAADERLRGRAVVVNPLVSCGRCRACARGADNQCPDQRSLGIQEPGGFAELVAVPARNVVALPDGVDLLAAAGTEPLAQAVHDVRLAQRDGDVHRALVIGCGAIGLLVVQAARLLGIAELSVVEPAAGRHAAARAAGAGSVHAGRDELLDAEDGAPAFDAVFDVVGTTGTRTDAATWTARGGTAVFVGLHEDASPIAWRDVLRREITVRGANASNRGEFAQAADWISRGVAGLPVDRPIGRLADTPDVLAALAAGSMAPAKALIAVADTGHYPGE